MKNEETYSFYLPSAKNDIREVRKWYGQFNNELPVRFKEEIKLIIEALKIRPYVHAIRYKNVRFAQLIKFPYAIHYFIDEDSFSINVIAVYHNSIDPFKWRLP